MTDQTIRAIEAILKRGHRVELIPGPNDSVKVLQVERNVILKCEKLK